LIFRRQYIYDLGGGPVWTVRTPQFHSLDHEQKPWAVRLDTSPESRSDWLFEREWRVPLNETDPTLPLSAANVVGILIGDAYWRPSTRDEWTGYYISGATGEMVGPDDPHAAEDLRPTQPALWTEVAGRIVWDQHTGEFGDVVV
jgi:hypothetical protein